MAADFTDRRFFFPRAAIAAMVVAAFALVIGLYGLATWYSAARFPAEPRAGDGAQTAGRISELSTTIGAARHAVRRHLLDGDATQLSTYRAARSRWAAEFANVEKEFEGNPAPLSLLPPLRSAIEAQFEIHNRGIDVAQRSGAVAGLKVIESDEQRRLLEDIHQIIDALELAPLSTTATPNSAATQRTALLPRLAVSLALLAAATIALARWLFRRHFDEANGWITVCAWTRRVQWQGRWISFEEYLARRFNLRCTHGICDEAAEKMKSEAARVNLPRAN